MTNQHEYKHYIIYSITNLVNGKIYIGKHKCNRLDDRYFGSGQVLKQAIRKYGAENFMFKLEIDLKSQEEMDLLEQLVVNEDFLKRPDVYNISRGGNNPCMYGANNPFFGKTHSANMRKKMSAMKKDKPLDQQHKDNISRGLRLMFAAHPEIRKRCATRAGKKKCVNAATGEIRFFDVNAIPTGFEIYVKPVKHVSDERKQQVKRERQYRASYSKWYNNGVDEKFCLIGTQPDGYVIGRLAGINAGRKYSDETKAKMRRSHMGKPTATKGKVCITNGVRNTYIGQNDKIPEGWKRGMTRIDDEIA